MWICKNCGEPHQDQFHECWKCAASQSQDSIKAGEPPLHPAPSPEDRKLRPLGFFVKWGVAGFVVVTILALGLLNFINPTATFEGQALFSLGVGGTAGIAVGLFCWVAFPYEPIEQKEADNKTSTFSD
jgi:hypothetical protein